jgi:O-antigen/teichoic acid export membrane protein
MVLGILCILFSQNIASAYVKDSNQAFLVILMAIMFLFMTIEALIMNVLISFQNHKAYALVQFLRQLLPLIFVSVLFINEKRVDYAMYATILSSLVILSIFGTMLIKKVNRIKGSIKQPFADKTILKNMLTFGLSITLVGIGGMVLQFTDTIMITFFLGTTASGVYNAALPIANILSYLSTALVIIILPLTSELWAKRLKSKLTDGLAFFYKYSALLILPFVVVVIAFADVIISLLFTQKYISAAPALQILVVGCFLYFIAQINFCILSGIGKPRITAIIIFTGAILNIILNSILIPSYGIIGAAIATSIGYGVMLVSSIMVLRKYVKLKIPFLHWIKTLILSLALLLMIILMRTLLKLNPYIEIIIIAAIGAAFYIGLAFLIRHIDTNEIKDTLSLLKKEKQ